MNLSTWCTCLICEVILDSAQDCLFPVLIFVDVEFPSLTENLRQGEEITRVVEVCRMFGVQVCFFYTGVLYSSRAIRNTYCESTIWDLSCDSEMLQCCPATLTDSSTTSCIVPLMMKKCENAFVSVIEHELLEQTRSPA